jgi:hypothetical protein
VTQTNRSEFWDEKIMKQVEEESDDESGRYPVRDAGAIGIDERLGE